MSKPVSLCAALEIPKAADANGPMFLRAIADALGGHDGGASAVRISVKHCAVAAERLIVKVETSLSGADANRVSFRLAGRPGRPSPDPDDAVAVLSDIVTRALPLVDANHVEWVQPGVLLTPEEFLAAQSYISPKRARSAESGPKAEDDADRIDQLVSELVREETSNFGADAPVLPHTPTQVMRAGREVGRGLPEAGGRRRSRSMHRSPRAGGKLVVHHRDRDDLASRRSAAVRPPCPSRQRHAHVGSRTGSHRRGTCPVAGGAPRADHPTGGLLRQGASSRSTIHVWMVKTTARVRGRRTRHCLSDRR